MNSTFREKNGQLLCAVGGKGEYQIRFALQVETHGLTIIMMLHKHMEKFE